jgi:alcohol dehydrogenase
LRSTGRWEVVFGDGSLSTVSAHLDGRGVRRVLVVTSPSVRASGAFDAVLEALGEVVVGVFDAVVPHVPRECVLGAARAFEEAGADAVVSLGGGSTSDAGKALRVAVGLGCSTVDDFDELAARPVADLVHVAVPTTLSSAEFSGVAGITEARTGRKQQVADPNLTPSLTVLDPRVVLHTPRSRWTPGLVKLVGDAVEVLTVDDLNPVVEPVGLQALTWLVRAAAADAVDTADGRLHAQLASWSTLFVAGQSSSRPHSRMGVATALRHVVAPALGVSHAGFSAALLPHVYRFEAGAVAQEQHRRLARAMDLGAPDGAVAAVAEALAQLVAGTGVASRLRDLGGARETVDRVVAPAADAIRASATRRRDVSEEDVRSLLAGAW